VSANKTQMMRPRRSSNLCSAKIQRLRRGFFGEVSS
jgi:hypothetical protein